MGKRRGGPVRARKPRGRAGSVGRLRLGLLPVAAQAEPLAIHYLERRIERPTPLNNEDPIPNDEGLKGAELGLKYSNATGRFVSLTFTLGSRVVGPDEDLRAAFRALGETPRFVVLNVPAEDVLALADMPEAKGTVFLNVGAPDSRLREADC
ncbi:ABC transporter substrate-binding protein, partial [Chryseobacterium phosphatilyticum]